MRKYLFLLLIIGGSSAYAFESQVTLSMDNLMANRDVAMNSRDKGQMLIVASRVFQLQLGASKCDEVLVIPMALEASEKNTFSVKSKNCVVMDKKSEKCDSDFSAKNISENPHAPGEGVMGGDIYKLCIKDTKANSGGTSSSTSEVAN